MSQVPVSPLAPGADGYTVVYDLWVAQGRAQFVEKQSEGWLRRANWPDPEASQPTFTLVCSASGVTSADLDGPASSGYGFAMATAQSSWRRRGSLPKNSV